jgi:L-threonylcarbamoyladenylate synthase
VPLILKVDARDPDPAVIRQAGDMIRAGLVVAYPTDTLYGLAVDPRNGAAVRRLFELKGRPEASALTLIAAELAQVRAAGALTSVAEQLAAHWWPGPLTILIEAGSIVAPETLAGGTTVGVRVPNDRVATALARDAGFCITATSANRSGAKAASTPGAVEAALPEVDAVLDAGPAPGGPPSTIVDASQRVLTLVRAGVVPWDRVLRSVK